jgi:signal peptidase II
LALKVKRLLLVIFPLLLIDQVSKQAAVIYLKNTPDIELFWGLFKLTYAENKGAFLSFGASFPDFLRFKLFTVLVAGFLIYLTYYLLRHEMEKLQFYAYAVLLAGGIGNLIDRAVYQYVIDFLWMGYGPIRTGVFNIADMAIMYGVIVLLIESIFFARKKKDSKESTPVEEA